MAKRHPWVAGLLAFMFFPLGYWYVGRFWRGIALFFLFVFPIALYLDSVGVGQDATLENWQEMELPEGIFYISVFARLLFVLDCFRIAMSSAEPQTTLAVQGPPPPSAPALNEQKVGKTPEISFQNLRCPKCGVGLVYPSERCPQCDAQMSFTEKAV